MRLSTSLAPIWSPTTFPSNWPLLTFSWSSPRPTSARSAQLSTGSRSRSARHDAKPVRREGYREQRWVLLDYLDIVVHVQHTDERRFYALERLWRDCPEIELRVDVRR